jgi:hypothetical protein
MRTIIPLAFCSVLLFLVSCSDIKAENATFNFSSEFSLATGERFRVRYMVLPEGMEPRYSPIFIFPVSKATSQWAPRYVAESKRFVLNGAASSVIFQPASLVLYTENAEATMLEGNHDKIRELVMARKDVTDLCYEAVNRRSEKK